MKLKSIRTAVLTMLTLVATSVGATPIHYNEAVDGYLPNGGPYPVLALGTGVNTVSGTGFVNLPVGGSGSADFDDFEFTVPAGTYLTAISYTSNITDDSANDSFLRMEVFLDDGNTFASYACQEFYIVNKISATPTCLVPPSNTFGAVLPLPANTYLLYEGQYRWSNYGTTDWNYTWSLTVTPVPEPSSPASLALGLALLGIGIVRRRRVSHGQAN